MSHLFVLDSSLALSWCFEDEKTEITQQVLDLLGESGSALVPSLWFWEINNVLWIAERRKRITAPKRHQQSALLQKLPIDMDEGAHRQTWTETTNLARAHNLTIYDAAYLELALRRGLPLGAVDTALRTASATAGLKLLPEEL